MTIPKNNGFAIHARISDFEAFLYCRLRINNKPKAKMTTSEVIAFIRGLARESEHLQLFKDPACWSVPEFLILRPPEQ